MMTRVRPYYSESTIIKYPVKAWETIDRNRQNAFFVLLSLHHPFYRLIGLTAIGRIGSVRTDCVWTCLRLDDRKDAVWPAFLEPRTLEHSILFKVFGLVIVFSPNFKTYSVLTRIRYLLRLNQKI